MAGYEIQHQLEVVCELENGSRDAEEARRALNRLRLQQVGLEKDVQWLRVALSQLTA